MLVALLTVVLAGCARGAGDAGGAGPALPLPWPADYSSLLEDGAEFEYVVVGGGAGGAAAAARLALAGRRVLLLEAGGAPGLLSRVPAAAQVLMGSPLDWADRTAPNNRSCLAAPHRACRYSRGRCLGGSSSINYMMYVRGGPADYDCWPKGWRWCDLEAHFLRWEGLQVLDRLPGSSRRYHNDSGIVKLEYFADPENLWHERLLTGLEGLGFPRNPDFNGASLVGVGRVVGYVWRGERMSTARAFLCDPRVRTRLHVAQHARATRVHIDEHGVARGVHLQLAGRSLLVRAGREVLLAAGTVGTAQLLLLSGVGPAEHLSAVGVPLRAALPVGRGLRDHALAVMFVLVPGAAPSLPSPLRVAQQGAAAARWLSARAGPLASNGLTDVVALFNDSCYDFERARLRDDAGCARPTLQLTHAYMERGALPAAPAVAQLGVDLADEVFEQLCAANARHALLVLNPILLAPASSGHVRLRGADPLLAPLVSPDYLSAAHDVRVLERGMRVVRRLVRCGRWRALGARVLRPRLAACGARRGGARYWRCYLRHMTHSGYHAVGTARLGPGGVVDGRLRVRGVRGLRVSDLSAAPTLPRGNTAALAITLGERAAHFALEDAEADAYGYKESRKHEDSCEDKEKDASEDKEPIENKYKNACEDNRQDQNQDECKSVDEDEVKDKDKHKKDECKDKDEDEDVECEEEDEDEDEEDEREDKDEVEEVERTENQDENEEKRENKDEKVQKDENVIEEARIGLLSHFDSSLLVD